MARQRSSAEQPDALSELYGASGCCARYRKCVVIIDGQKVGSIPDGERREFAVPQDLTAFAFPAGPT